MSDEERPEEQDSSYAEAEEARVVSLDEMNSRLSRLEQLLSKVVPGSHGDAEKRTEERLDRPSSVAEQVRAELARRDKEQQETAERDAKASEEADLRAKVKALTEKAPAPPERRSTKLMWGGQR